MGLRQRFIKFARWFCMDDRIGKNAYEEVKQERDRYKKALEWLEENCGDGWEYPGGLRWSINGLFYKDKTLLEAIEKAMEE